MSSIHPTRAAGRTLITAGGLALIAAVYQRLLRERVLNWGATPARSG